MSTNILKAVRKSSGISQTELALATKTFQANLSSIENGNTDPGLSTIENYLAVLGYSLIAVPTTKPSVAQFALLISSALAEKKEEKAFRLFIQLHDNLSSLEPGICVVLSIAPAPATGDLRYDALIAALVEYHLCATLLPIPNWVKSPTRKLTTRWIVDPHAISKTLLLRKTPKAFLRHNILIDASELVSI